MKVLITGGAGYIGTKLIYSLAEMDNITEIVAYDNLSRPNMNLFLGQVKLPSKVKFIQGELLDSRKLNKILANIDVVYHLAAKVTTPFADHDPNFFEQVNHWGTAQLVDLVKNHNVKKFIYLSTVSVYGHSEDEVTEKTVATPSSFYGISKLRGEHHVALLNGKIPFSIIRCGNVYGYGKSMRFDAVINKFMFNANFNRKVQIVGHGEQYRPFVHVDTVSKELENCINEELKSSISNLVSANYSVNEIGGVLKEIYPDLDLIYMNQDIPIRYLKVKPTHLSEHTLTSELLEFKNMFTF